jgi:hypothetical protein
MDPCYNFLKLYLTEEHGKVEQYRTPFYYPSKNIFLEMNVLPVIVLNHGASLITALELDRASIPTEPAYKRSLDH